jgi:hypothetical protein
MILMKTRTTTARHQSKKKASHLKITFISYRKYRNHKRFVRSDLL